MELRIVIDVARKTHSAYINGGRLLQAMAGVNMWERSNG